MQVHAIKSTIAVAEMIDIAGMIAVAKMIGIAKTICIAGMIAVAKMIGIANAFDIARTITIASATIIARMIAIASKNETKRLSQSKNIGEMAEWSKAAVSKTVNPLPRILGFESPSLRKTDNQKISIASDADFV